MDTTTLVLVGLFAVCVLGFAVLFVFAERASKKMREERQAWANRRGWTYSASDQALARSWYSPNARSGGKVRAAQVVRGSWRGRPVLAFIHGHRDRIFWDSEETRSVVAVVLPAPLPTVRLWALDERRSRLQKGKKEVGVGPVQPPDGRIGQYWQVWAQDERTAGRLLHGGMVDRLLNSSVTDTSVYFRGNVLFVMNSRHIPLAQIDPTLDMLCDLADLIPPDLYSHELR